MDNIAHALAGAALGQAGLKRLSGLAMPALVLSANLPDIDAFAMLTETGLAFRRGWTHGPIALAALPALLAALFVGFDRWQMRRGKRPDSRLPVKFGPMLLLCYIGALSHIPLDLLNTYGIRFLMPFSERWFYGDVLFVIDPWMWLSLGLGVWLARRSGRLGKSNFYRPAVAGILFALVYIGAMYAAGRAAERFVARELTASGSTQHDEILASPVPADPLRREIVVRSADGYRFGDVRWNPWPRLNMEPDTIPANMDDPAIARAAAENKRFAAFLYWSRYPFATVERSGCTTRVTINDGRYSRRSEGGPFRTSVLLNDC